MKEEEIYLTIQPIFSLSYKYANYKVFFSKGF